MFFPCSDGGGQAGASLSLVLIKRIFRETTQRAGPVHLRTMRHRDDRIQSRTSEAGILSPSGHLAALGIGCTSGADLEVT